MQERSFIDMIKFRKQLFKLGQLVRKTAATQRGVQIKSNLIR